MNTITTRYITLLLAVVLAGCSTATTPRATSSLLVTPTIESTPTLPPTSVPGSIADEREVVDTVRQFGEAVTRGDDVVALLVLSPSAQQLVAAGDVNGFLGAPSRPQSLTIRDVRLSGDVAIAECIMRTSGADHAVRLQLVRLEGVWKIDARINTE